VRAANRLLALLLLLALTGQTATAQGLQYKTPEKEPVYIYNKGLRAQR
jgi:hypothetical protein